MPAIASILHRVSGVVLFLLIPMALWALSFSLASEENFQHMQEALATPMAKLIIWVCLMPFIYHFVAGTRHLLMDINIGVELRSGKLGAILTFIVTFIFILLAGIYIW